MPVVIADKKIARDSLKPSLTEKTRTRRASLKAASVLQSKMPQLRNDLRPELHLAEIPIADLKVPKRMVRKFGPEHVAEVANSIRQFGVSAPVLVGNGNAVIDGAVVIEAAKTLGLESLPCVLVGHLSPAEQRAFRLVVNRMGHTRAYDLAELKLEFEELRFEQLPLELLGFSDAEIDSVLQPEATTETAVEEPSVEAIPVTKCGDTWIMGRHRLVCGDAKDESDFTRLMGEDRAQLALTDPPYCVGVGKVVSTPHRDFVEGGADMDEASFNALITRSFSWIRWWLVDGGLLLSFMDWKHIADLVVIGKSLNFELVNIITWVKHQPGMGSLWRSQSEFVVALKKPGKHKNNVQLGANGRDRSNVWQVAGAGTIGTDAREMLADHPTPKPVQMLADAILDVTDRHDIVLDPFAGSGSTLMACVETDRVARLIERDPLYCDLIVRRWQKATGEHAVLEDTGERFLAIEDRGYAQGGDEKGESDA